MGSPDSLPPDSPGMKELTAAALHQADQPSGAMKLAQIAISRKDVKTAGIVVFQSFEMGCHFIRGAP